MTTNFTLRLPNDLAAAIDSVRGNMPRTTWIMNRLRDQFPGDYEEKMVGYIELTNPVYPSVCSECGSTTIAGPVYLGVVDVPNGPALVGPMCRNCVE